MSVYARRGRLVRCVYLALALGWWLATLCGRFGGKRVVTLCYHGVTREQRDRFRRQMAWIADLPRRRACVRVTFDDAFANLLDNALPVMRELAIPPTVFAVSGNLGAVPRWDMAPDHPDAGSMIMTAEQLARTAADGACRIGAHGVTHRRLPALPAAALTEELAGSRSALEAIVRGPVRDFAFPYGACDRRVIAAALDAGYERVYTLDPPSGVRRGGALVITRMSMSPDAWPLEFALTAAGAYRWLLPLRRLLARLLGADRRELRVAGPAAHAA